MIDIEEFSKKLLAALSKVGELSLQDLLARGYFPKELPPAFSTTSFSKCVTELGVKLPIDFTKKKNTWCGYTSYSLARPGALRRRLAILNPLAYYRLSAEVVKHQQRLFKLASSRVLCLSQPTVQERSARAISMRSSHNDLPAARARSRVGKLFVLKTDIARFYPSVYTHTLDWAITGKEKAKRDFGPKVNRIGKRIDGLIQAAQAGQTRGIPIGPDTSLLFAHILLSPVDKLLKSKVSLNGFRFQDDYELVFATRSQAEEALATLEEGLAEYELELNSLKTRIDDLPVEFDNEAIASLRGTLLRLESDAAWPDLISFFNSAFRYSRMHPEIAILRFAVGRLNKLSALGDQFKIIQDFILQCITVEPGVWPIALPLLKRLYDERKISLDGVALVVEATISRQAPRNHSSEVAWSLWASLVFEIQLSAKCVKRVIRMNDDVCSLLLLHAVHLNLAVLDAWSNKQLIKRANPNELFGEHWLFAYEGVVKNWVPTSGNYFVPKSVFSFLKDEGVSFYDESKLVEARRSSKEGEASAAEEEPGDYGNFYLDLDDDDYEEDVEEDDNEDEDEA